MALGIKVDKATDEHNRHTGQSAYCVQPREGQELAPVMLQHLYVAVPLSIGASARSEEHRALMAQVVEWVRDRHSSRLAEKATFKHWKPRLMGLVKERWVY